MFVFRVLNTVPYSNEAGAKDLVASLHSFFTTNLLVGLAVLVSFKQFGGRPIECMVPTDFTSAWVQYVDNYCWSKDTYYIPFSEPIAGEMRSGERISYYQWMPFFLLFNAACFRLPCFIWKYFASQSGMRVGEILRMASDDNNAVPDVKHANIRSLRIHLQGVLRFHKRAKLQNYLPHKWFRFLNVKYSTYYVTMIYFIAKLAFLGNVVFQFRILNKFLLDDETSESFGYHTWKSFLTGNETWTESGLFPRVSLCDFEVREMGNMQNYTVQCVLLLNVFTEKIFVMLWIWYILLTTFTAANIMSWFVVLFNDTSKEHFVINHLEMCETTFCKENPTDRAQVDCFVEKYLGIDGIFILRLIAQHVDVVFTTELVGELWRSHQEIESQRRTIKMMNEKLPPNTESEPDGRRFSVAGSRKTSVAKRKQSMLGLPDESPLRRANSELVLKSDGGEDGRARLSSDDEETKSRKKSVTSSPKKATGSPKKSVVISPSKH